MLRTDGFPEKRAFQPDKTCHLPSALLNLAPLFYVRINSRKFDAISSGTKTYDQTEHERLPPIPTRNGDLSNRKASFIGQQVNLTGHLVATLVIAT